MKQHSLPIIHLILFVVTAAGIKNHVTILPPLLLQAGRSSWASVLIATFFMIPVAFLLLYIHKKTDQKEIKKVLEEQIGTVWTKIFIFMLVAFLFALTSFTMRETMLWITYSFLIRTPEVLLLFIFTALCMTLAVTNVRTIAITNVLLLFGILFFGVFAGVVNIQVKNYHLLQPFFEEGFKPIWEGVVYPAAGMMEITLLLFFHHYTKERMRPYHYAIILAILTILTLGPLVGAITEFGPDEAMKQHFPAYEEWGLVTIGRFIEHLDFLSIYQWLAGAFIRIGLMLFIVVQLFELGKKPKLVWIFIAPSFFALSFFLMTLEDHVFMKIKGMYFLPVSFAFLLFVLLFLGMITYLYYKAQGRETNGTKQSKQ